VAAARAPNIQPLPQTELIVVSSNERQINDNGQGGAGLTAKKLMATAISCLGPLASGIGKNTSKDTDNIRGLLAEAGKS
jgi:hypothetical protein